MYMCANSSIPFRRNRYIETSRDRDTYFDSERVVASRCLETRSRERRNIDLDRGQVRGRPDSAVTRGQMLPCRKSGTIIDAPVDRRMRGTRTSVRPVLEDDEVARPASRVINDHLGGAN